MFLDVLRRRNPELLRAAVDLHRRGHVPANAYVLDLDTIGENAALLASACGDLGLRAFAMTKQFGRNPPAMKAIAANGIEAAVAVDMACAHAIHRSGGRLGHIGHLVQVARHDAPAAAAMRPEYWTVFTEEKGFEAGVTARAEGSTQQVIARVHADGDRFYPGHEGGFAAADIIEVARRLDDIEGVRFAGVTTFPALLFDSHLRRTEPTPNLSTLARAADALRRHGYTDVVVNAPGTTSVRALSMLADAGATQVEPGHAFTGTTPWHAVEDLPERPAMLYVSEVSHVAAGRSYFFGGGLYVDPVFPPYQVRALVVDDVEALDRQPVDAYLPNSDAIDYYGQLEGQHRTGSTVLLGFRAQAFVTRAVVAPVSGISTGTPRLDGLWTTQGTPMDRAVG